MAGRTYRWKLNKYAKRAAEAGGFPPRKICFMLAARHRQQRFLESFALKRNQPRSKTVQFRVCVYMFCCLCVAGDLAAAARAPAAPGRVRPATLTGDAAAMPPPPPPPAPKPKPVWQVRAEFCEIRDRLRAKKSSSAKTRNRTNDKIWVCLTRTCKLVLLS